MEKLATGGMAEVYLAKAATTVGATRFIALKRILPHLSENSQFIQMFRSEAKVVMNLSHTNIVTVNDFGLEEGQFYLSMEFLAGQNLLQMYEHLQQFRISLSIQQIAFIGREVASGLHYAHHAVDASTGQPLNLIHRDMSPQNIMISYEGEVKIIDFGVAKAETQIDSTTAGALKGKFAYMSPEQIAGQALDARADIFSLGIVLWEMLAKARLFTGSDTPQILASVKELKIPTLTEVDSTIPQELSSIVKRMLARNKEVRYQTAEEVARDLSHFLNTKYPEFTMEDFSRFLKKNFSETYAKLRMKLTDYSKIEMAEGESVLRQKSRTSEKTEITTASIDDGLLDLEPSRHHLTKLDSLKLPDAKVLTAETSVAVVSTQERPASKVPDFNPHEEQRTNQKRTDLWIGLSLVLLLTALGGGYAWRKFKGRPAVAQVSADGPIYILRQNANGQVECVPNTGPCPESFGK